MIFYNDCLDFSDVLLVPKFRENVVEINSRKDVNLVVKYSFVNSCSYRVEFTGIPIMSSNMDTIGTLDVANVLSEYKMLTTLHKYHTVEDFKNKDYDPNYLVLSAGTSGDDEINVTEILQYNQKIKYLCLDVANGYSPNFKRTVQHYRNKFSRLGLFAGNVATPSGALSLTASGADFVKSGIGNGSVCTTRIKTGVGMPQFSLVENLTHSGVRVLSDGGCTNSGDIAKAFGAGAKFVMLGGMLAGHNETSSTFYGMSSENAMEKFSNGVATYKTAEGKCVNVQERGELKNTIENILGGLRSACAYTNSHLQDFIGKQDFVKVNRQVNNIFT